MKRLQELAFEERWVKACSAGVLFSYGASGLLSLLYLSAFTYYRVLRREKDAVSSTKVLIL